MKDQTSIFYRYKTEINAKSLDGGVRFTPNKNKLMPDVIPDLGARGGRPISPSRVVGDSCCGDVSYSSAVDFRLEPP